MSSRARRLLRGWVAALVATGLGAASHAAVDGHWPPVMVVLLTAALAAPVCIALAGRALSRVAVALSVAVSQGLLHWLFAQSGHAVTAADHTHHGFSAGSGVASEPSLVISVVPGVQEYGTDMLAAHIVAALATYGLLRHGEVSLARMVNSLSLKVLQALPMVIPPVAVPVRARVGWMSPRALADQLLLPVVHGYRGPPRWVAGPAAG